MALNQNQFQQTPIQGQIDLLGFGSNVVSAMVAVGSGALVAGQAVKLVNDGSPIPKVTALTANTDATWGFVSYNLKDQSFPENARVEIALLNSVMYMTAGAAIARGAKIEVVYTTTKVITNAGTNPVVGFAYDQAQNDGDIIRVFILTQSYQSAQVIADVAGLQAALDVLTAGVLADVKQVRVVATLAQINAGLEIVPASTGKKIRVLNYAARVTGAFTTTTSVDLQDNTAQKVTALGVAGLTNGALLLPSSGNTTLGVGFAADGATGSNLVVANTGSAAAGGTNIAFTVTYAYV